MTASHSNAVLRGVPLCLPACGMQACGERAWSVLEMGMQVMQVQTCNLPQQPDVVCYVSPKHHSWESMVHMPMGLN